MQSGLRLEGVHLLPAKIIRAALHVADAQRASERFGEEGNVFVIKLILKVLGARRDDHALAAGKRGDEIGERLAGSSSGPNEQVLALLKRLGDGARHLQLALAVFIIWMALLQPPAGSESVLYTSNRDRRIQRRTLRNRSRSRGVSRFRFRFSWCFGWHAGSLDRKDTSRIA